MSDAHRTLPDKQTLALSPRRDDEAVARVSRAASKPAREELLVDVASFETRIALVADGQLRALHIERADAPSLVGNLYIGKVLRVVPSIQAAFVDVGLPRAGFLHVRDMHQAGPARGGPRDEEADIADLLHQDQRLLVQIIKDPLNEKGVRLATDVALSARYLVLRPFAKGVGVSRLIDDEAERQRLKNLVESLRQSAVDQCGVIVRTAARTVGEERLGADMDLLRSRWAIAQERCRDAGAGTTLVLEELPATVRAVRDLATSTLTAIVVNDDLAHRQLADYVERTMPAFAGRIRRYRGASPLFDAYDLEAAILRATARRVALPGGGCLLIEETAAMTTIDVNSGSAEATGKAEETVLRTNLQAADVIPLELRRRNIGGIVVVDFIDMTNPAHQKEVLLALRQAAAADPAPFRASGFSPLGLVEISRRRVRDSLARQISERCPVCAGSGRAKSAQSVCFEIFRAVQRRQHIDDDASEYVVYAGPAVVERLLGEEAPHLAAVGRQAGRPITLQVEPSYRDEFDLLSRCSR